MENNFKHIVTIILVLSTNILFSQTEKETKNIYKSAENHFSSQNYKSAYFLLKKIKNSSYKSVSTTYMSAICEMKYKNNYATSINLLESIRINNKKNEYPNKLYFYLGESYHFEYDFENALTNFKLYKKLIKEATEINSDEIIKVDRKIKLCNDAKKIYQTKKHYEINNLWLRVNSRWEDYAPIISADETTLIFTSKRGAGISPKTDFNGDYYSDIYISQKSNDNKWGYAKLLSRNLNSEYHDISSCLSADGQKLFIYKSNEKNEEGIILKTNLNGSIWEDPKILGSSINSKDISSRVSISANEDALYFTYKSNDENGQKDIYVSHKLDNGNWSEPENLGNRVNTIYDEESPFIHPDGKTLFFSSKGHNNMGGYDIFKTVYDGTSWSTPENLGYPLNSTKDDLYFVLSANGKNGYFSSTRKDSYGKDDIYQIKMPESNIPLTMIRGNILCSDSLKPLRVIIKVKDVETGEFIKHVYKPNPATGKYLIILPPGKNYDMIISTNGYIPYVLNVFIPNQTEFYELYQTIYLKTLKKNNKSLGQGISIDNSFFNSKGNLKDIDGIRRKGPDDQKKLQDLINKIINISDSLSLKNLNKIVESNFDESSTTINIDTNYKSLLNFVNQVFENTDSTALKHTNNLIERGFYTYAENNTYKYNNSDQLADSLTMETDGFELLESLFSPNINISEDNKVSILFDSKESKIKNNYFNLIDNLIVKFNKNGNQTFTINGHTDNVGTEESNIILSKQRVKEIEKYLINKGISKNKINLKWHGESEPLKTNNTNEERNKNRRVEISLINLSNE